MKTWKYLAWSASRALVGGSATLWACVVALDGSAAQAQCSGEWVQVAEVGPGPRIYATAAYDSVRHRVLLFGGRSSQNALPTGTWSWSQGAWSLLTASGPGGRDQAAMVYDSTRDRMVLFGGWNGASFTNETWEFDGAKWSLRSTSGPTARNATMAFDSSRGVTVLFGGYGDATGYTSETWEWNGATWVHRALAGPSPRERPALAFDSNRHVVVLFGGSDANAHSLADTWEYDGLAWSLRSNVGPSARDTVAIAYDTHAARTVLFGGFTWPGSPYFGDTWSWDGSAWLQIAGTQGPSLRGLAPGTFDQSRGRFFVFGGQTSDLVIRGDSWEFAFTPVIVSQPSPATPCPLGTAQFQVAAGGPGQLSYQWRYAAEVLEDESGHIAGATTNLLTITGATEADTGDYDCIVSSSCGNTISDPATLTICPIDFNCDSFVSGIDFDEYVQAFEAGDPRADFDSDGFITGIDFDLFVQAFEEGC